METSNFIKECFGDFVLFISYTLQKSFNSSFRLFLVNCFLKFHFNFMCVFYEMCMKSNSKRVHIWASSRRTFFYLQQNCLRNPAGSMCWLYQPFPSSLSFWNKKCFVDHVSSYVSVLNETFCFLWKAFFLYQNRRLFLSCGLFSRSRKSKKSPIDLYCRELSTEHNKITINRKKWCVLGVFLNPWS